jgi:hypothetical protein
MLVVLMLSLLFVGCGDDCPTKSGDGPGGPPVFTKTDAFGMGISRAAAWADYDGDTDLDLAVGNDGQNYLYTNDGVGSFTETAAFGALGTRSLMWMDTDGDLDLDLVVGSSGQNYIYVNQGGGAFTEVAALGGATTSGLAHGDLDGDMDEDIVVTNWISGATIIYTNSGSNDFVLEATLPRAISVAVFDADDDDDLDIILGAGCCYDTSKVYTNDGAGGFSLHSSFGTGETEMTNLSWSDYDGDGDIDLISGCGDNGAEYLPLWIYDNDGAGNFTASVALADTIFFSHVLFGDVDGDSDDDVIVGTAGFLHDRLAVYYNDMGSFTKETIETGSGPVPYPFTGAANAIAAADADKDNDLDIAVLRMDWVDEFDTQPAQNSLYMNEGP